MPRRNSGGSSSGRRGSSRTKNEGGSFSGKRKPAGKPFKKPGTSSGRARSTSFNENEERRGFKKATRPSGNRSDSPESRARSFGNKRRSFSSDPGSGERPFKRESKSPFKKDKDFKKGPSYGLPFKRKYDKRKGGEDFSGENRKRSFSGEGRQPGKKEERGFFKKSKSRYSERPKKNQPEQVSPSAQTDKIRLNKYIANSGVCSRREADELISMGLISVNGKTITELGYKVNPGDEVKYENKVLKAEKPVYVLMNKPKGYLTTTEDPQERNTVMHIIGGAVKERVYPVGRLDRNTTGLLLLTNDGDLAEKLMHPSYNVKKIYKVELDRPLTKADFQNVLDGVMLEEGRAVVDDLAIVSEDGKTIGVELHIGWNRVVRRIFESLNYEIVRLDRSVYAGLDKKDLGRGEWRYLTKEEIVRLKHYK